MAAVPKPPAEWMQEVMTYWLKHPDLSGVLHLPERGLPEIPNEVCQMKNVVVLSFPRNQIAKFPKKIDNMKDTLKEIDLSQNRLTKLPSSLA
jgi:Leucine-rich repeat (LRR) protein